MYFIQRLLREPAYRSGFGERLRLPQGLLNRQSGSVWLHAVSVGEVTSLLPLLQLLRERLPGVPLYLSTSTIAGRQAAQRQAEPFVQGILYLPFDLEVTLVPAFNRLRPWLLIIAETELWPNLFALAKRSGTSLAIVNGRISDRTWPSYYKWRALFRAVLRLPDFVHVQSQTDYERYSTLGVSRSNLSLDANLKYDARSEKRPPDLPDFGAEQIWIAASTVGPNERGSSQRHSIDEDDLVLDAFQKLAPKFPRLLLILAPRQPARFDEVARKLQQRKLSHTRRSAQAVTLQLPGVLLLDTVGELASLYSLANVVFVGGSLAPRGGHNIIEPAAMGAPVIVGPHLENFAAISQDFRTANAIVLVQSGDELAAAVDNLLADPHQAKQLGERGKQLVQQRSGVSDRLARELVPLYYEGAFSRLRHGFSRLLLQALSSLWQLGGIYKRRRGERFANTAWPLPVPVISVGGLSMGGTGKTPFTVYLASTLRSLGYSPAILTRGYRRQVKTELLLPAGAEAGSALTGDEAQIFLRRGVSPIGIGSHRYRVSQQLLEAFPETNILLLDDGFQHASIKRTIDIVLVDALDPFSNGAVFPQGRLREPLQALKRADCVVVTRCETHARFEAIRRQVRRVKPGMPLFRTETRPGVWRNAKTGEPITLLPQTAIAAFCGLGNPESFWQTLEALRLRIVVRRAFRDHHRYRASDMQKLSQEARREGASVMVTTEKDFFNLSKEALGSLNLNLSLLYLPIEMVISEATEFWQMVQTRLVKVFGNK